MAKLTRQTILLFGSTGVSTDFGEFGSLAASAPVTTKTISTIQSLAAWGLGWADATIGTFIPAYQDMNSVFYVAYYAICYMLQEGIAEWDSGTTYYTNSVCQYNGVLYQSLIDTNLNNEPDTSSSDWQCISQNVYGGVVASTSSMTLPNKGSSFKVSGTTTINNITAQSAGIIVELIFEGSLTVNIGGNILLNSVPFNTVANNTLTLICDGTNWFELSRSPAQPKFGTPISQTGNTNYQASTNGFVYGCINMAGASSQDGSATFYSSLNSNPTISPTAEIPFVMQVNSTAYDIDFPFCFPVSAGEYYRITTGSFTNVQAMYFRSS